MPTEPAGRDLLRPTGIRIASSEKGTPIHPTGVKMPKAAQKNAHREHHLIQKTLALLRAAMPPPQCSRISRPVARAHSGCTRERLALILATKSREFDGGTTHGRL